MTRFSLGLIFFVAFAAHAEPTCPVIAEGSDALAGRSANERLSFMQGELTRESRRIRAWTWSWVGVNSLFLAANLVMIPLTEDPRVRGSLGVWAGFGALGIAQFFILPVDVSPFGDPLEPIYDVPCGRLAEAERHFLAAAENEASGVDLLSHVIYDAAALLPGAIIMIAWPEQWQDTLIWTLVGLAMTEVSIWTQPTGMVRALAAYRNGMPTDPPAISNVRFNAIPFASSDGKVGAMASFGFTF